MFVYAGKGIYNVTEVILDGEMQIVLGCFYKIVVHSTNDIMI